MKRDGDRSGDLADPLPEALAELERRLQADADALAPAAELRQHVLGRVRRELHSDSAAADAPRGQCEATPARPGAESWWADARFYGHAAALAGFLLLVNASLGAGVWRGAAAPDPSAARVAALAAELEALDLGLPPRELRRQGLLLSLSEQPLPPSPPPRAGRLPVPGEF